MRSVFYIPANNPKLLSRSPEIPADVITLDLEDSVPDGEKEEAQQLAAQHLVAAASSGAQVYCRVNSWDTGLTAADLDAVVGANLHGVCLPKCDRSEHVLRLDDSLRRLEGERGLRQGSIRVQLLIESAKGVLHAYEAAVASPRVIALIFGAVDFARDMQTPPEAGGAVLAYPRAHVAVAARAAGLIAIDSAYIKFRDTEGFESDTMEGRLLGYQGRLLIHPSQVSPAHRLYAPTEAETAWALKVVEVFETVALPGGRAAVSLEGMMIDTPMYEAARRILGATR